MSTSARHVRYPTEEDLTAALRVIREHLPATPLVASPVLGDGVWLKLETMQPTGAFKVRGAIAALSAVTFEARHVRLVTASAGNHALGMAWAAARLGVAVTVVVAATTSPAKLEALARLPVDLVIHGESYDDAEAHALALARDDTVYISPYNDPRVIAGQATIGPELVAQLEERQVSVEGSLTIVAGVGGGGLTAGLALWANGGWVEHPKRLCRVIGVESERSLAVSTAVRAGETVAVPVGETLAETLAGNIEPGSITVPVIRDHVETLLTVSEDEIEAAMRWLAREHGLVVEGAGAVSVATLLSGKVPLADGGSTVAILTGRNIALSRYAAVLGR